jgi:hypothetical protein
MKEERKEQMEQRREERKEGMERNGRARSLKR